MTNVGTYTATAKLSDKAKSKISDNIHIAQRKYTADAYCIFEKNIREDF